MADIQRCNRETAVGKKLSSRILVISSLGDSALQYVPTMNCIFAAQKNVSAVFWDRPFCLPKGMSTTYVTFLGLSVHKTLCTV